MYRMTCHIYVPIKHGVSYKLKYLEDTKLGMRTAHFDCKNKGEHLQISKENPY